jgi:hypothetical protein
MALICTWPVVPTGQSPSGSGPHPFLSSWEGVVSKQGQRPLQRSRSLWRVLRRRGGVDRALLERRVREAMEADPQPYHPTRNNCVHFALRLLDVEGSPDWVSTAQLPTWLPTRLTHAPAKFRPPLPAPPRHVSPDSSSTLAGPSPRNQTGLPQPCWVPHSMKPCGPLQVGVGSQLTDLDTRIYCSPPSPSPSPAFPQ